METAPIAIPLEMPGHALDWMRALSALPFPVFLDSAAFHGERGRYSYLCADPFHVEGDAAGLDAIRTAMAPWRGTSLPDFAPFQGGGVFLLSYGLSRRLERLPPARSHETPDLQCAFYDVVIALDHLRGSAALLSTGQPERGAARRARAWERAQHILRHVQASPPAWGAAPPLRPEPTVTQAEYERMVARARDFIFAGDIYQVNLSQEFRAVYPGDYDFLRLYERLRRVNAAPFSAYLHWGPLHLLSASPERFLRLAGQRIETRPIKGTRPRDGDPGRDQAERARLRESPKDRAENLMIVDLLRNDLSRVARTGSVVVPELFSIESFAHVHHLVSSVQGELRPECDALDLLAASFPGGSITGAPKIRAMEIIHELECAERGPYCGSLGWLGFDGAMDSSILIRTISAQDGLLRFRVGGGIVADSEPAAEYRETMDKARGLLLALQ
jgi:para-aminobenzoate synthetase component 1